MKWWVPILWVAIPLLWLAQWVPWEWFLFKWLGEQNKRLEEEVSKKAKS